MAEISKTKEEKGPVNLEGSAEFEERVAKAFQHKQGFADLNESDKFVVVNRGSFITCKLLNGEWYPNGTSWYNDTEQGIWQLINDVAAYYDATTSDRKKSFVEFLRSADDEEFYALTDKIPGEMRRVLIRQLYSENPPNFNDGLGKLQKRWDMAIRRTLSDFYWNNPEKFLEVLLAHHKLDLFCAKHGHKTRLRTYSTLVPIAFRLACQKAEATGQFYSGAGKQNAEKMEDSQVIEKATVFILHELNEEDIWSLITEAWLLENFAIVKRSFKFDPNKR